MMGLRVRVDVAVMQIPSFEDPEQCERSPSQAAGLQNPFRSGLALSACRSDVFIQKASASSMSGSTRVRFEPLLPLLALHA
jgi:hypothetical protein